MPVWTIRTMMFHILFALVSGTTASVFPKLVQVQNERDKERDASPRVPTFPGSELVQKDRSWADWRRYTAAGFQYPGWPEHFNELTSDYYKEWQPRVRAQPTVCVVSLYTSSLLTQNSWGAYAAEINLNWALSHGYKYAIFRKKLGNETSSILWTKPRLVLFMLEQGELECKWVFSIDGDAVVNKIERSIEGLQLKFLPDASLSQLRSTEESVTGKEFPEMLMTCHWHHGNMGRCQKCMCFNLNDENACSEAETMHEFERNSHCGVNSGVYLLHNSPSSREMMRWWAGAGKGSCSWDGDNKFEAKLDLAEQKCSNRMKAIFPRRINIVNAGVMNMPSWYSKGSGKAMLTVDKNAGFASHVKCFQTDVFVCHTLGLRDPRTRRRIFKGILSRRRGEVQRACARRQERYVELSRVIGNGSDWWVTEE